MILIKFFNPLKLLELLKFFIFFNAMIISASWDFLVLQDVLRIFYSFIFFLIFEIYLFFEIVWLFKNLKFFDSMRFLDILWNFPIVKESVILWNPPSPWFKFLRDSLFSLVYDSFRFFDSFGIFDLFAFVDFWNSFKFFDFLIL